MHPTLTVSTGTQTQSSTAAAYSNANYHPRRTKPDIITLLCVHVCSRSFALKLNLKYFVTDTPILFGILQAAVCFIDILALQHM